MVGRERVLVSLLVLCGAFFLSGCGKDYRGSLGYETHTIRDKDGIAYAVSKGDLDKVKSLVADNPELVNGDIKEWPWGRGVYPHRTPLHWAAFEGHKEIAEYLIDQSANVEARDVYARSPLAVAAAKGDEDMVELLLARGANVNTKGDPPLNLATSYRQWDISRLLVAHGADVNWRWPKDTHNPIRNLTYLHNAVLANDMALAKFIIEHGADLNARNTYGGETALHLAVLENRYSMVKLLVAKGADVNAKKTDNGETPLHFAAIKQHYATVKLLVAKGADVNAKTDDGRTPLDFSESPIHRNKPNNPTARLLRKHGAVRGSGL